MDLKLIRHEYRADGVFGELLDSENNHVCVTLEHAYLQDDGTYAPKIPPGDYTCVRGQHRLHSMTEDFETFEITNVPGHTNILLHWGNFGQKDSDGCVLVGEAEIDSAGNHKMITNSRATFQAFLELESGLDSFLIEVQ